MRFTRAIKKTTAMYDRQASHWHDKRFTPWHAIWGANEGIKNSWQCARRRVSSVAMLVGWSSACHAAVAKILKCSKNVFPRCHDLSRRNCSAHMHDIGCMSRISRTVRNLCATHGTTWHDVAQTSQYAPLAIVSEAHSKKMSARKSTRYAER